MNYTIQYITVKCNAIHYNTTQNVLDSFIFAMLFIHSFRLFL